MRHRNHRHRLSRPVGPREALMRNLAVALVEHERIRTTVAKAKALRPFIERLVTLGREDSTHRRRLVFQKLQKKNAVTKLFDTLGPRNAQRPGGYTRIILDNRRQGDGAEMAYIEFVEKAPEAAAAAAGDADAAKGGADA
ncbi:MAG: 50S ribosomal protein L17 [Candidatus Sumerlaeia bacterium]|nr:50S ribosomal protein L17 [Candidatus Sumerlaeia bacterium]